MKTSMDISVSKFAPGIPGAQLVGKTKHVHRSKTIYLILVQLFNSNIKQFLSFNSFVLHLKV